MSLFNVFQLWKIFLICCLYFYCVGAVISASMSTSDGLGRYTFHGKIEKKRLMEKEMDEKLFVSRQSRNFFR